MSIFIAEKRTSSILGLSHSYDSTSMKKYVEDQNMIDSKIVRARRYSESSSDYFTYSHGSVRIDGLIKEVELMQLGLENSF